MNMQKKKGISLISLVVTIIVLVLLASAVVVALVGNGSIINAANSAKRQSDIATIKEEIQTSIYGKKAANQGNISDETLIEVLEVWGTLSDEENVMDRTLTTTRGNYEIRVVDIFNGTTVADVPHETPTEEPEEPNPDAPTFTTVANAPDISGFDKNNTYYVSWDLASSPYVVNDTTLISGVAPSNWYDYTAGINQWANIKTTGGGNDCYLVWIPRYAYCITEGYHSATAGTIDIKFLSGTTNTPLDGSNITISNTSGAGNWNVHPAFWWDENNNGVEDEGEQLSGIWVAKFEASSSSTEVVENPTPAQLSTRGGGNDVSLKVRVKPNVTCWRGISINNIFTVCRNLTKTSNSLENTNNLNSHMMKNVEWGALVYLSRSAYGAGVEIYNNPYQNNNTEYSSITGLCGWRSQDTNLSTTNLDDTTKYNTTNGVRASVTGNVYGVYDMAGGAWEFVAAYFAGGTQSTFASVLWDPNNLKYVDVYQNISGNEYTYFGNTGKYGDAFYEVSANSNSYNIWEPNIQARFFTVSAPLMARGGCANQGTDSGVFAYRNHGYDKEYDLATTFRPVVVKGQP